MGKLIWKEMTLEEVKAVQVGDKVRIDGIEDEVSYLYNRVEDDYGFGTKKEHHGCNIVNSSNVEDMEYKFEHLVEETEMNTRLERDREYDVKLTGEQIALCKLLLGKTNGTLTYEAYCVFSDLLPLHPTLPYGVNLSDLFGSEGKVTDWLDKVFAVPETEDQRKLRELEEKHAELGKAIEAMRKK